MGGLVGTMRPPVLMLVLAAVTLDRITAIEEGELEWSTKDVVNRGEHARM